MNEIRSLSIVVPVFNERESIGPLLAELRRALRSMRIPHEIVFVDDGSTDGSREALTAIAETEMDVRVVVLRRNFGKGAALMAGFAEATGEAIVTIDGDLQDDPAEIPRLLAELADGADLVSGWKSERRDPWTKRFASRVFNAVTRWVSGVRLHDLNCGFKAYRREVVQALALTGDLYRYIPVLAASEGFRVREIAVNHRPRRFGKSKYGIERYVRGLLDLLTITFIGRFRNRPMHLFGGTGLLLALAGLVISAYMAALRFSGEAIGTRPLLLLGVVLVVVGIQLITIGLLSEMVQRNHLRRSIDEAAVRVSHVVGGEEPT